MKWWHIAIVLGVIALAGVTVAKNLDLSKVPGLNDCEKVYYTCLDDCYNQLDAKYPDTFVVPATGEVIDNEAKDSMKEVCMNSCSAEEGACRPKDTGYGHDKWLKKTSPDLIPV